MFKSKSIWLLIALVLVTAYLSACDTKKVDKAIVKDVDQQINDLNK